MSDDLPGDGAGKATAGVAPAGQITIQGLPPGFSGVFSPTGGHWSEAEQNRLNGFFRHWIEMLRAELSEKERTIIEIVQRLDIHDEQVAARVVSGEYRALLRKGFRDWSGTESEDKRLLIRNILANAGATTIVSDDVVRLFMEWVKAYSELHFRVVSKIYNKSGATRADVWGALGRGPVREDSADADLFKLLFRDLSTGGLIRQHRVVDYAGNFVVSRPVPIRGPRQVGPRPMKSAFDDGEAYELTQLGQQFIHYAMTDLPLKIAYQAAGA